MNTTTSQPSRWTRKAALAAYASGTESVTLPGGRKATVVISPSLQGALTSLPRLAVHKWIAAGPWTADGRLEAYLR